MWTRLIEIVDYTKHMLTANCLFPCSLLPPSWLREMVKKFDLRDRFRQYTAYWNHRRKNSKHDTSNSIVIRLVLPFDLDVDRFVSFSSYHSLLIIRHEWWTIDKIPCLSRDKTTDNTLNEQSLFRQCPIERFSSFSVMKRCFKIDLYSASAR
jgi:hypothetical protein